MVYNARALIARFATYKNGLQADDFGLGFLWSWIYGTWFTAGVFPASFFATSSLGGVAFGDRSWLISLLCCSALLFAAPAILRRWSPSRRLLMVSAAFAVCASTMLLHFSLDASSPLLHYLAAALTGVGSAAMWALWGERYGAKTPSLGLLAPVSAAVVAVVVMVCWVVPESAAFGLCLALPLVSALLFLVPAPTAGAGSLPVAVKGASPTAAEDSEARSCAGAAGAAGADRKKSFSVLVKLCIYVAAACGLCSFARMASSGLPGAPESTALAPGVVVGMAIVILVAWRARRTSRLFDFVSTVRWLLLLEVVAFALLIADIPGTSWVAVVLSLAVSSCFDFLLFFCMTRVIERAIVASTTAFCLSEGSVQVGWLVGDGVSAVFLSAWGGDADAMRLAYALLVCLLFVLMLLIVDQQGTLEKIIGEEGSREATEKLGRSYGLSPRETEILVFLAQGRSVPYISDELFLAKTTVETHVKHIYKKMGVHSRQELLDLLRP